MLFIHITRLASNEIFSPSDKIHREVGRAEDLPAPLYIERLPVFLARCLHMWGTIVVRGRPHSASPN